MAVALETVVKQLEDSGIVAQGKLENFIPPKASPKDAEELIAQLVKENHLTKFQAAQVAAGKSKSLILGGYTIQDRIGAGGMGQVFKALHRRMDRTVAVKMLPSATMKDAAAIARFEREVRAAAKLRHPNIVAADDADQANGVHFLVMEYVEGQDLSALVKKNGPFPVTKATNYILQAARGLEFAHKKGVVHRDIKPANLLLDNEGTVKILDMGLARIESDGDTATQAELTGTGAVMGTVDYMAPEQAMSTKSADARADIYSLGCSLFYLLTGKPTYEGETITAKLVAHQAHLIPELRKACSEASAELESVFSKMLAKKLEDRYQSMSEVVADLERLGVGQQTSLSIQQSASTNLDNSALTFLKNIPIQQTVQKSKATKKVAPTKSSDGKQPPWKNTKVLIGAGLLGLLILAGIIVSLRTKDGTLIVEVDQPDAMVQVLDAEGKVEVSQKGGVGKVTISVDPGKHRLRVEKDGFAVFGQEFEMEKGGEKAITAKLVKQVAVIAQPNKPWNTPDFQAWIRQVAAMPAEEQFKSVVQKLHELNPEYKSVYPPKYSQESGNVTEFILRAVSGLNDLSPLRALPGLKTVGLGQCGPFTDLSALQGHSLVSLYIDGTQVADLSALKGMPLEVLALSSVVTDISPLKGMPLNTLSMFHTRATSLSALQGMKLTRLEFDNCRIGDLSPLSGMPLTFLTCSRSQVVDLSPLKGMPLVNLHCGATPIKNLSPLEDCQTLATLNVTATKVTPASVAALQAKLPNCKIEWDDPAKISTPQPAAPLGPAPPLAVAPFDAAQAKAHQAAWSKHLDTDVVKPNSIGMQMTLIPHGEFLMGSSDADVTLALKIAEETKLDSNGVNRIQEERPQHRVRITQPFRLAAHEVTIGQFGKFVEQAKYKTQAEEFGGNSGTVKPEEVKPDSLKLNWRTPSQAVTDDSPVTQVSWNDAVAFCNWLSGQEKLDLCYQRDGDTWILLPKANGYRLPTEAEWEYACRAGTTTQYSFGDDWQEHDKYGWTNKNAGGRPHSVGSLPANPFGLYDMHGNVWEWCQDWYDGKWYENSPQDDPTGPSRASHRVARGGGWYYLPASSRSSSRSISTPSDRIYYRGFRPALSSVGATTATAAFLASKTAQPANADPDRSCAEWALSIGGKVTVLLPATDGSLIEQEITDKAKLPTGKLLLGGVNISPSTRVTGKDLERFAGLKQLRRLNLEQTTLTGGSLQPIAGLTNLTHLTLGLGLSANEAKHLVALTKLDYLSLKMPLSDNQVPFVTRSPGMRSFQISYSQIGSEGLKEIVKALPKLDRLWLPYTKSLTNDSVAALRNHPLLRNINLNGVPISDQAIVELATIPNLEGLYIQDTRVTDDGLVAIAEMPRLKMLQITSNLSDVAIAHLSKTQPLTILRFNSRKPEPAVVEHLQKALPNCKIDWDDPANATTPTPAASGTK